MTKRGPNRPGGLPAWWDKIWDEGLIWEDEAPKVLAAKKLAAAKVQRELKAHWEKRRVALLAQAEQKQREFRAELAWLDREEKRAQAIEREREEQCESAVKYAAKLKAAMRESLKRQDESASRRPQSLHRI
jgi:hypothetical protein